MTMFDDLIRAGRDIDAMRFLAQEYYDNGKMGHTRKLLLERVADDYESLQAQLAECQRRERAAVEDIEKILKDEVSQTCEVCLLYDGCHRSNAECERDAKWRGLQAGEEGK